MNKLKQAGQIASSIAGAPTAIRFVGVAKTHTGLSVPANVMGANLAQLMAKSRRMGCDAVTWRYRQVGHPKEALQGLHELEVQGIITTATRGRIWLDTAMPDPAHRHMFINWDGDHQNRVSPHWEQHWLDAVYAKIIRPL